MCASRPRIQIKWESVKKGRHLLSLVSLGKGGEEVVVEKFPAVTSATIYTTHITLLKNGGRSREVKAPWTQV
jgi:hypothetical protein